MSEKDRQDTAAEVFFADPKNMQVISDFIRVLESGVLDVPMAPDVVDPLRRILQMMISSRALFDTHCRFNIRRIGEQFISGLETYSRRVPADRPQALTDLFTMTYRFLCEFNLSQGGAVGHDARFVMNFVHDNLEEFSEKDRSQLVYAAYMMPANVLGTLLHDPAWRELRQAADSVSKAEVLKKTWDDELDSKQQHLEALSRKIDELKVRYNFVALSKGFQDLLEQKRRDLRRAYIALLALGGVMLLPVAAQVIFAATHIDQIDLHKGTLMYVLPGILTIEILLFYFFRVALTHHNSLKAQILQLDLRVSLCQFIESYAEYAKRIRSEDKSALDKFEQLIFSGLVATEADIPSTFDGIDQVGKLLTALKGKP